MPEMFKAKVRRVGTSFGVLIPRGVSARAGIREGEHVEVGLLKERRIDLIEKAFGIARGAGPFHRDRKDRF